MKVGCSIISRGAIKKWHIVGIAENLYVTKPILNDRVSLWQGDIKTLDVDAIVTWTTTTITTETAILKCDNYPAKCETFSKTLQLCASNHFPYFPDVIQIKSPENVGQVQDCYFSVLSTMLRNKLKTLVSIHNFFVFCKILNIFKRVAAAILHFNCWFPGISVFSHGNTRKWRSSSHCSEGNTRFSQWKSQIGQKKNNLKS